jgi:hypothetical protein
LVTTETLLPPPPTDEITPAPVIVIVVPSGSTTPNAKVVAIGKSVGAIARKEATPELPFGVAITSFAVPEGSDTVRDATPALTVTALAPGKVKSISFIPFTLHFVILQSPVYL